MTLDYVRYVQRWETTSVSALPPGWRNAYREGGEILTGPCPAILVQELLSIDRCEDLLCPDGTYTLDVRAIPQQSPYETRVVFADFDTDYIMPAVDVGNYVGTLAPGESAERYERETAS